MKVIVAAVRNYLTVKEKIFRQSFWRESDDIVLSTSSCHSCYLLVKGIGEKIIKFASICQGSSLQENENGQKRTVAERSPSQIAPVNLPKRVRHLDSDNGPRRPSARTSLRFQAIYYHHRRRPRRGSRFYKGWLVILRDRISFRGLCLLLDVRNRFVRVLSCGCGTRCLRSLYIWSGTMRYSKPAYVYGNSFVLNIIIFLSVSPEAVSGKSWPFCFWIYYFCPRGSGSCFL